MNKLGKDVLEVSVSHNPVIGKYCRIELWYPRISDIKAVHVGLSDVRAADDVRIEFDYARDGWSIKQASIFQWETPDEICDSDWQEVSFIQAWGRKKDE